MSGSLGKCVNGRRRTDGRTDGRMDGGRTEDRRTSAISKDPSAKAGGPKSRMRVAM